MIHLLGSLFKSVCVCVFLNCSLFWVGMERERFSLIN